eukprot:10529525-Karenia_brevis.AAC.1
MDTRANGQRRIGIRTKAPTKVVVRVLVGAHPGRTGARVVEEMEDAALRHRPPVSGAPAGDSSAAVQYSCIPECILKCT